MLFSVATFDFDSDINRVLLFMLPQLQLWPSFTRMKVEAIISDRKVRNVKKLQNSLTITMFVRIYENKLGLSLQAWRGL